MADAPKYAMGGIIRNYDGTLDDVPIRVNDCGYRITEPMARRYGRAFLDRLNRSSEVPPDG